MISSVISMFYLSLNWNQWDLKAILACIHKISKNCPKYLSRDIICIFLGVPFGGNRQEGTNDKSAEWHHNTSDMTSVRDSGVGMQGHNGNIFITMQVSQFWRPCNLLQMPLNSLQELNASERKSNILSPPHLQSYCVKVWSKVHTIAA